MRPQSGLGAGMPPYVHAIPSRFADGCLLKYPRAWGAYIDREIYERDFILSAMEA